MTDGRVILAVSVERFMRWHEVLRSALARRWPDRAVLFRVDPAPEPQAEAVMLLLELERLLLRRGRTALCDRRAPSPDHATTELYQDDIVVDLVGDESFPNGARVLRPLYDGHATVEGAVAAILDGAAPTLGVEDAATGRVLAEGLPSFEAVDNLTAGLDAVYSRVGVLIEMALANDGAQGREAAPPTMRAARRPAPFLLRNLAFQAARRMYRLCCHSPHWRIGWRFNDGPGVMETFSLRGPRWRVAPDFDKAFSADPFPIEWRGRLGFFYERLDYRTDKGEIYFQELDDAGVKGEAVPVLSEPWHLSYPFLIEEDGALYMAPEASASNAVTLYRCVDFPQKWEPVAKLVAGVEASDATIFRHGGRYWMTSVTRDGFGGYSDTLAIHHAPSLFGAWEPHRSTPALIDSRHARPAGAVYRHGDHLLRPAQDCSRGYGKAIAFMRVDRLDEAEFRQTPVGHLSPGAAWPGARLHTINRHGRLECIDGAIFTPKFPPLRKLIHQYIDDASNV